MFKRVPLWRKTPPAVFPVLLGFMGLGLAWRNAARAYPVPDQIGELLSGLAVALFLFFLMSYVAKVIARPAVVMEDLNSPQARAGVAAISMGLMVLAATLIPFGAIAAWVWVTGVALHGVIMVLVVKSMRKVAPEGRSASPFQLLPFVGWIVAPVGGFPLGFVVESKVLSAISLVGFVVIVVAYGMKVIRIRPPQLLRPSLVIFLAPVSLFALASAQFQYDLAFDVFYWAAVVLALLFLSLALWLTQGGWTPVWGSFTFPIATFTSLQAVAMIRGSYTIVATTMLVAGLIVGTSLILFIVYKAFQAWTRGDLARKTGAATA